MLCRSRSDDGEDDILLLFVNRFAGEACTLQAAAASETVLAALLCTAITFYHLLSRVVIVVIQCIVRRSLTLGKNNGIQSGPIVSSSTDTVQYRTS